MSIATAPSAAARDGPDIAEADRVAVGGERHVEEDDPSLDAIAKRVELLEAVDNEQIRLRRRTAACRRCCRARA